MRPIILMLFFLMLGMLLFFKATAQICTGSLGDPVVNETFGESGPSGIGPPLPAGITNLLYTTNPCTDGEGQYGLFTGMRGCNAGTWHVLFGDHTGDPNGLYLLINGPNVPSEVYRKVVSGSLLCPNTTYEFAAWVMNILVLTDTTKDWVKPDLTFSIETTDGKVLKTYDIGGIPETAQPVWNHYGTYFTTPSDGSDIVVRLSDNQTTLGFGNDFAVDDITFRPCGALIMAGFGSATGVTAKEQCQGTDSTYTLVASQLGYFKPTFQWQKNTNDGKGWVNISSATDSIYTAILNQPAAGLIQYRVGILNASSTSLACNIYSQPLNVEVNPYPVTGLPATTDVCQGQPLQLAADQADTYQWTGPNGFTSTDSSPVITASADASFNGVYSVTVVKGGCSSSGSTKVTVYPAVYTATVNNDTTICQGQSVTLAVSNSPAATMFSWKPLTGLSQADGSSVIAKPQQTTSYTVTVGNGGCYAITRTVKITVLTTPTARTGPARAITQGDTVKLYGTVTGDSVSYYWTPAAYLDNPNSLTPIAAPIDNTTYTLHAISNGGCGEDTSSVYVRVYRKISVPNTFTPNNDGINDFWDIKNLITYPDCSVLVFDRYGSPVYKSTGYARPWDGKYHNSPLPFGTYYYIIDLGNDTPKMAGWVLIVR